MWRELTDDLSETIFGNLNLSVSLLAKLSLSKSTIAATNIEKKNGCRKEFCQSVIIELFSLLINNIKRDHIGSRSSFCYLSRMTSWSMLVYTSIHKKGYFIQRHSRQNARVCKWDIHAYKRITGFSALIHSIHKFSRTERSRSIIMRIDETEWRINIKQASNHFILVRSFNSSLARTD